MKIKLLLLLMILLTLYSPAFGQYIEIRVSVKVILHPTNGTRPSGITDNLLNTAAANSNNWMASYWRGYRFRITEIQDIGGPSQGGSNGPSKWFGEVPGASFQNDTRTDSRYLLRSDQVNFYITTGVAGPADSGGGCSGLANETACYGFVNTGPWWLVHETGHFFGLPHTFGGMLCPKATSPGDDGISDTLPEIDCWTRDQISNNAYGVPYDSLRTAGQRKLVEDTYLNVMSYHEAATKDMVEDRMTELQLDLHADTANGARAAFVSGRTRFVSLSGSDSGAGSSTSPYRTVLKAVTVANAAGGDIILLRPGAYNGTLTINKPCTLRATRVGPASIGSPVAP